MRGGNKGKERKREGMVGVVVVNTVVVDLIEAMEDDDTMLVSLSCLFGLSCLLPSWKSKQMKPW